MEGWKDGRVRAQLKPIRMRLVLHLVSRTGACMCVVRVKDVSTCV